MKLWQLAPHSNNSLNQIIREFAGDPHPTDYHGCWMKCCMFAALALKDKFKLATQVVPSGVSVAGLSKIEVIHTELVSKLETGEMVWDLSNLDPKSVCAGFYITNWTSNVAIEAFLNLRSNLPDAISYSKGERCSSSSGVLDYPLDIVNLTE